MAVAYRAVKANDSDDVIAIGYDEDQGGQDYNGVGVWCDFTFDKIPELDKETSEYIYMNEKRCNILKVKDGTIVVKTLAEITE